MQSEGSGGRGHCGIAILISDERRDAGGDALGIRADDDPGLPRLDVMRQRDLPRHDAGKTGRQRFDYGQSEVFCV